MNPDDNFSPPLNGLGRGKKLHQVLLSLKDSDIIYQTYQMEDSTAIGSLVDVDELVETSEERPTIGVLACNWWHMPLEEDWWKYEYIEFPELNDEQIESLQEDESVDITLNHFFGWYNQENDEIDGTTYIREFDDGWKYEEFNPKAKAPKPLTRAILDTHLPSKIKNRHQDD